ncbi:MAG: hypothetical protein K0S08_957 [Gammaproteobacteria bacterium]|nr:hypothetical protein [Gammaproteobacteria bacterium]
MIHIRWRIISNNILHHLFLIGAVLLLLWALFLTACRLALPYLPRYQSVVAEVLSSVIGSPVTFGSLSSSWLKMQPVVTLNDVNIWTQNKQRPLMQIPQVNVRFNLLSSLLHREVEVSLLQIKQWQLKLYQNSQGQWKVAGIQNLSPQNASDTAEVALDDFMQAMSQIRHLQLQKNTITISLQDHSQIKIPNLNLDWYAKNKKISLYGTALLQSDNTASLQLGAEAVVEPGQSFFKSLTGHGYLKFSNFVPAELFKKKSASLLDNFQGKLNGEIWGVWQKDHWEDAATKLHVDNFKVEKKLVTHTWGMSADSADIFLSTQQKDLQKQVYFSVNSSQGQITLSNIFRSQIPYEKINFKGNWVLGENETISIPLVQVKTQDADASAKLSLAWGKQQEPQMDLLAKVNFSTLKNKSQYLPAGIMPKAVVSWLDSGIKDGKSADAEMLWHGPLKHFPFHDQSGTMQIFGAVKGVILNYAPHWPLITNLDANLFFTSHGMHIDALKGAIGTLPISQVSVDIPEFKSQSQLLIHGNVQGNLTQAWDFLATSPLKNTLSPLLDQTSADGLFTLGLSITLPLHDHLAPTYQGVLNLQQDQLSLKSQPITFSKLTGQLNFDDESLQSKNLTAQWLNEPWQFNLSRSAKSDSVHFQASGNAPLGSWVANQFKFAAKWFQGTAYCVTDMLVKADKSFSLVLKSDLKNLETHVPGDINKAAATSTPFSISFKKATQQPLTLELHWLTSSGELAVFMQDNNWHVKSPSIEGTILPPDSNISYWQVSFNYLDLKSFDFSASGSDNKISLDDIPAINILANHVVLTNSTIQTLKLNLRPDKASDSVKINSLVIKEAPFTLTSSGRWSKQPDGKSLTQLKGRVVSSQVSNMLKALNLPPLLETSQATVDFNLSWPDALWQFDRENLSGNVKITTAGGLFTDVSAQTNTKVNFGRLLNFLSLNALPSRLASGFSGMSQKGFPFDQVNGTMTVAPQRIQDINMNITGPVANVLLNGCLNLLSNRLNLVAEINPKLTGSLPVIATIAGGPIMGAISFVADKIISPAVGKISGSYYALTGDENNPQTNKVDAVQKQQILASCPI